MHFAGSIPAESNMILHYLEHKSWNEKDNDYTGIPSTVFMSFINHNKCIVNIIFSICNDEYTINKNCLITDENNLFFVKKIIRIK